MLPPKDGARVAAQFSALDYSFLLFQLAGTVNRGAKVLMYNCHSATLKLRSQSRNGPQYAKSRAKKTDKARMHKQAHA